MMRSPKRIAELVENYLDGTLGPRGREELLRRLKEDAGVRRAFLEQLDFSNLVSELYRADDFAMNTLEKLEELRRIPEDAEHQRRALTTRRRHASNNASSGAAWSLVAAAILIAVATLAVLGRSDSGRAATPRVNEAREQRWIAPDARRPKERERREREGAAADVEEGARDAGAQLRQTPARRQAMLPPTAESAGDSPATSGGRKDREPKKRDPQRLEEELRPWPSAPEKVEPPAAAATSRGEMSPATPTAPPASSPGATQASLARVEEVEGDAFRVTKDGKAALGAGAELFEAEGLETGGGGSRIVLRFADKTRVELGPESVMTELKVDSGKRLGLSRGSLRAVVARQPAEQAMVIATPHSQARVLGTTLRIQIDRDPAKGTRLDVEEGKVELRNLAGKSVLVQGGFFAVAAAGAELVAKPRAFWEGALAVYLFNEGRGTKIHDASRRGMPLDLRIENESSVRWLPRGMEIVSPTLIASVKPARKIIGACKTSNEVTLELWVRPATLAPAETDGRIATLSADPGNQNVFVGQEAAEGPMGSYFARLRTTETNSVGKPILASREGRAELKLVHLVYTRSSKGAAVLYVDGEEESRAATPGALAAWDDEYRLGLGNEFTHNRPWLGEYRFVAVYGRALSAEDVKEHHRAGIE
jgi:hypothetical protein